MILNGEYYNVRKLSMKVPGSQVRKEYSPYVKARGHILLTKRRPDFLDMDCGGVQSVRNGWKLLGT